MTRRLIALDLTMAPLRPTGGSYYAINLVRALGRVDKEHDYIVYARSHTARQLGFVAENVRLRDVGDIPRWRRYVWEQSALPLALRRDGAALLHSPHYTMPYLYSPCPRVVTVHDLRFFLFPERFTLARRLLFQAAIMLASRRAHAIVVPSQSTAEDLCLFTRVRPDKVHVTYEGVDPGFRPLERRACARLVAERYGLPQGYLLSVGTREPGKNRGVIYRALALLAREGRDLRLVVVGGSGWRTGDETAELRSLGLEQRVHYTGYVPQEDLPAIYNAASVFVFPSLHEGFGLAALEAMACGTPVVASTRAALPEVVGDAGLLVDANDHEALAGAIASILDDADLAARLRAAGSERARGFSWDACAQRTIEVYERVLEETGR